MAGMAAKLSSIFPTTCTHAISCGTATQEETAWTATWCKQKYRTVLVTAMPQTLWRVEKKSQGASRCAPQQHNEGLSCLPYLAEPPSNGHKIAVN